MTASALQRAIAAVRAGWVEGWVSQEGTTDRGQDKSARALGHQVIDMTCVPVRTAIGRGHAARIFARDSTLRHAHAAATILGKRR
jgi:hypothetical protein